MWRSLAFGLTIVCFTVLISSAEEPLELERALVRKAPALIAKFKEKGYRNVGVLKFMAAKEEGKLTDNVGTLNLLLARRLELALVLANETRDKNPVGIIENASAVAQNIPGASHLSRDNRLKLFSAQYPLAWGNQKVQPDAFLTGMVVVSRDLKLLTISLMSFDRSDNKLAPILEDLTVKNRPDQLAELGESFVMRGGFEGGKAELALSEAEKVKSAAAVHPAVDPKAPVKLEIQYDGRAVPVDVRDGIARVPEPQEGQRVELVLRRGESPFGRLKAVLKVNGESTTSNKQRLPDAACWGWFLERGSRPSLIGGYYFDDGTVEKFRVLSRAESKAREIDYGADVGTITLTVFRERAEKRPLPKLDDEDEVKVAAVAKTALPSEKPKNFAALKATLLEDADRGLLGGGERVKSGSLEAVSFDADPVPVMSLTIVYYKP
jgi:hypothetical protein